MSTKNTSYHNCLAEINEIVMVRQEELEENLADHGKLTRLFNLYYRVHRHYGTFLKLYNEMPEDGARDKSVVYEMVLHHYHENAALLDTLTACAKLLEYIPDLDRVVWSDYGDSFAVHIILAECLDYLPKPKKPSRPGRLVKTVPIRRTCVDCSPTANLYLGLFGRLPENDMDESCLPRLIALIDEALRENEALVIKMRFGFGGEVRTLAQCASEIGVTRERVRQIEKKAMRKLRCTSRSDDRIRYLFMTHAELYAELEASKRELGVSVQKNRELAIDNNRYMTQLEKFVDDAAKEQLSKLRDDEMVDILCIPIESLDLSVRSYNCLKRAGVNNVNALIDLLKEKKLIDVRNLGMKSTQEIEEKMRNMGFTFPDN